MRLSEQAIGVLMVTLQKCILEQTNIIDILKGYNFQFNEEDETISVTNPPQKLTTSNHTEVLPEEKSTVGSD